MTIPASIPAGTWFWCAILDAAGGVVNESDEGNNTILGNQVTAQQLLLADDFSNGLGNWTVNDPDGFGSWTIVNGALVGDYSIGCGSPGCNHTQLLLNDSLQPGNRNWRLEVEALADTAYCCFNGGASVQAAKFVLFVSDGEKEAISGGYSWPGPTPPPTADSAFVAHALFPWANVGFVQQAVPTWSTTSPQLVVLEKIGNTYSVYFRGSLRYSATRTFTTAPKIGFDTYGRFRVDNVRLYGLP
ncbi:MAG: hypothetical protein IPG75_19770 [Gemmatimonadetes bacterium]|nr:hypothetical protein [Gemmatimonadota bacterium]